MARKPARGQRVAATRKGRGRGSGAKPARSKAKSAPKKTAKTAGQTAYQRRIARALAQGKTLQEARGHKAKEHVARRERELREGETTYQRGAIKKFAEKQAKRSDTDADAAVAKYRRLAKTHGWNAFVRIREEIQKLSRLKRYRPERRRGRKTKVIDLTAAVDRADARRARNIARMEELADEYDIDFELLFYH